MLTKWFLLMMLGCSLTTMTVSACCGQDASNEAPDKLDSVKQETHRFRRVALNNVKEELNKDLIRKGLHGLHHNATNTSVNHVNEAPSGSDRKIIDSIRRLLSDDVPTGLPLTTSTELPSTATAKMMTLPPPTTNSTTTSTEVPSPTTSTTTAKPSTTTSTKLPSSTTTTTTTTTKMTTGPPVVLPTTTSTTTVMPSTNKAAEATTTMSPTTASSKNLPEGGSDAPTAHSDAGDQQIIDILHGGFHTPDVPSKDQDLTTLPPPHNSDRIDELPKSKDSKEDWDFVLSRGERVVTDSPDSRSLPPIPKDFVEWNN